MTGNADDGSEELNLEKMLETIDAGIAAQVAAVIALKANASDVVKSDIIGKFEKIKEDYHLIDNLLDKICGKNKNICVPNLDSIMAVVSQLTLGELGRKAYVEENFLCLKMLVSNFKKLKGRNLKNENNVFEKLAETIYYVCLLSGVVYEGHRGDIKYRNPYYKSFEFDLPVSIDMKNIINKIFGNVEKIDKDKITLYLDVITPEIRIGLAHFPESIRLYSENYKKHTAQNILPSRMQFEVIKEAIFKSEELNYNPKNIREYILKLKFDSDVKLSSCGM